MVSAASQIGEISPPSGTSYPIQHQFPNIWQQLPVLACSARGRVDGESQQLGQQLGLGKYPLDIRLDDIDHIDIRALSYHG